MRYFISVGEPSGDLHAANLIARLRRRDPGAELVGFGGDKMLSAGCRLLYPLADAPVMGFSQAIAGLPKFIGLIRQATRYFERRRPDVVVLIDYPGFNWHIARRAKQAGIPVCYYVPPQIWGWANWRVNKVRRFIDHVLCSLPFEEAWYRQRGVTNVRYVGHPFFDDLHDRRVDASFIQQQRARGGRIVALLPGSRTLEVKRNFAGMVASAQRIVQQVPDCRFLVAGFKEQHRPLFEQTLAGAKLPVDLCIGKTPEIIQLAESAIAVSGSVSLELLFHAVPTAVVYRTGLFMQYVMRPLLLKSPYISLVNLMAGRTIFPEFLGCRDLHQPVADTIAQWLRDEQRRLQIVDWLVRLKRLYATPGASDRAADHICKCAGIEPSIRLAG